MIERDFIGTIFNILNLSKNNCRKAIFGENDNKDDKNNNINVLYHFIKNNNNSIKGPDAKRCGDMYLKLFENKVHDYERSLIKS